jgi:hypothetical protein
MLALGHVAGQLAETAATTIHATCVRSGRQESGERDCECADESDDLGNAVERHSVGLPDPTGDLAEPGQRNSATKRS